MLILGFLKTTLLDYPGQTASLIFTGGCNMRCPYCQNGQLVEDVKKAVPVPEEEVLAHLRKRKGLITGLCISGGEPTLQKDLEEFIKRVKEIGINVKLDTNGTNPDVLKLLLDKNLIDYVAMDIKAAPKRYGALFDSPSKEFVNRIKKSVNLLKESGAAYEFRTTVCDGLFTEEDALSIASWIAGDMPFFLQPYRETENVLNPVYDTPSGETLERYVNLMKPYLPQVKIRG